MRHSALLGLVRFHVRSSVRVTLRNTAGLTALLAVALGMSPDPGAILQTAALAIAAGERGAVLLLLLWLLVIARAAQGPLATTLAGWHRHLALSRSDHRRGVLLATTLCQAPVLLLGWLLWGLGATSPEVQEVAWAVPLALLAAGPATAIAAGRWQPSTGSLLGLLALCALAIGGTSGTGIALALLAGFERIDAAALAAPKVATPRPRFAAMPWLLTWRIALRAVGLRALANSGLLACAALGGAWLFLRNNSLNPWEQTVGARVGGGLAIIAVLVPVAAELRSTRPPWPWLRSLPGSSRQRLLLDAGFLTLLSLPVLLAVLALAPWAVPPLLGATLFQTIRLAAALRDERDTITRLSPEATAEVWVLQLAVAAWPWTAWLLATGTWWATRQGTRSERRMKVSRWRERHTVASAETH
jgi:hypothetical protein